MENFWEDAQICCEFGVSSLDKEHAERILERELATDEWAEISHYLECWELQPVAL